MLEQSGKDVIIIDEQVDTDGLDTVHLTTSWGECAKQEEAGWATCSPAQKQFIKPRVEEVDDHWYQGEDCVDPSGIAPAAKRVILPAADGSLALKQDAAMPGASRGHTKYKTHDLVCRLGYLKAKRVEGRLEPISLAELLARHQRQKDLIVSDTFWQDEIVNSIYTPGPDDTPVNFAIRAQLGKVKAIPYWVAAPMAWEYPYAYGQLQESLTDRLVTASLYGIQLIRLGYSSPQAGPEVCSDSDWTAAGWCSG